MRQMRDCTLEELNDFLRIYPRHLERDVNAIYEPPIVTFNDFTLGSWPDSVVAAFRMGIPADPNAAADSPYAKEEPEQGYRILADGVP